MKSLNMDWLNVYGTKSFKSEQYYTVLWTVGQYLNLVLQISLVNWQEREKETR